MFVLRELLRPSNVSLCPVFNCLHDKALGTCTILEDVNFAADLALIAHQMYCDKATELYKFPGQMLLKVKKN